VFLVTEILKWAVYNVMSTVAVVGCRHMKILLLVHCEVRVIDYVRYYQEVWRNGDIALGRMLGVSMTKYLHFRESNPGGKSIIMLAVIIIAVVTELTELPWLLLLMVV